MVFFSGFKADRIFRILLSGVVKLGLFFFLSFHIPVLFCQYKRRGEQIVSLAQTDSCKSKICFFYTLPESDA